MENIDIGTIIGVIITGFATFFGVFWAKVKGKLSKVVSLIREAYEAINEIEESLKDDKLTKNEIAEIRKQLNDVKTAFRELIKKKET